MTEETLSKEEFRQLVQKAAWHWKEYYEKWGVDSETAKSLAIKKIKFILNKLNLKMMVGPKVLPSKEVDKDV